MSDAVTITTTNEVIETTESPEEVVSCVISEDEIVINAFDGSPPAQGQELIQAGQALSAYKMIAPNGAGKYVYADKDTPGHAYIVYGITKQAINNNSAGLAQTYGPVENDTWNWEPGKAIFLAEDGEMTQTPPSSGFSLVVAYPITATRIFIDIGIPIMLI